MLFNKYLFILYFILNSFLLFSQENKENKIESEHLILYTRYQLIGKFKLSEWKTFSDNYNSNFVPKEKLGDFKQIFNYDIGIRLPIGNMYTNISYQHYHGRAIASFINNEERIFDMYANSYCWGFGYTFKKKTKRMSLSTFLNMNIRDKIRIVSTYQYPDGFQSMGHEKGLNGTYMGLGLLGEEIGLLFRYRFTSNIALEIETSKMWANTVTPSSIDDKSLYKAFETIGTNTSSTTGMTDKLSAFKLLVGISFSF